MVNENIQEFLTKADITSLHLLVNLLLQQHPAPLMFFGQGVCILKQELFTILFVLNLLVNLVEFRHSSCFLLSLPKFRLLHLVVTLLLVTVLHRLMMLLAVELARASLELKLETSELH